MEVGIEAAAGAGDEERLASGAMGRGGGGSTSTCTGRSVEAAKGDRAAASTGEVDAGADPYGFVGAGAARHSAVVCEVDCGWWTQEPAGCLPDDPVLAGVLGVRCLFLPDVDDDDDDDAAEVGTTLMRPERWRALRLRCPLGANISCVPVD